MAKDGGLLCVVNDIAPTCDRRDYEAWYQQDHVPDRLGIPGFQHARRYRRLNGPRPEFLTCALLRALSQALGGTD